MNNNSTKLLSLVADPDTLKWLDSSLADLPIYSTEKFCSLHDFLLKPDLPKTDLAIIKFDYKEDLNSKNIHSYLKEELGIPIIYLVDASRTDFKENKYSLQPFEFITDPKNKREVELAVKLALEKYAADKIIKNGELQFKILMENSNDLFTLIDNKGTIKYESPSIKKLLGFTPEEIMGKTIFELIYAEDLENTKKVFAQNVKSAKESFVIRFRYVAKCGLIKNIEALFKNLLKVPGVESIIITGKDITEKKSLEKKFLQNIRRYNTLLENLPIGIYRSTPAGELLMANHFLINMLGYSSFQEFSTIDINTSYVQKNIRDIFKELVNKFGEAKGFEFEIKKKNGEIIFVRDSSRAIYDEAGNIIFYEGVLEDISDKKKFERELINAKDIAEKADKLKSCFMAQLSHEIRTPVNSIITFVSLLKEEFEKKLTDELKESFSIINNSADRLTRTIDLIMNIASLQTGNFDTQFELLNIEKDILANVLRDMEIKARSKEIKILFNSKAVKKIIYADRYSSSQIFTHLIDNAIKYTPLKGEIEINIHNSDEKILVDIIDTGIGISSEYLPNLFTPFTQEDMGYTRKFDGNGLGLAIAKKYAEINKAMINVKSVKGKGSNFTVVFEAFKKVPTENFS